MIADTGTISEYCLLLFPLGIIFHILLFPWLTVQAAIVLISLGQAVFIFLVKHKFEECLFPISKLFPLGDRRYGSVLKRANCCSRGWGSDPCTQV